MNRVSILWILLGMMACTQSTPPEPIVPTATPNPTETPIVGVDFATKPVKSVPVVQVTSTPLPTPTLTPEPTPSSYEVVSGDTLWGIAYKTGADIEKLTEMNPQLSPDQLSVGDVLLVPPPPTPIFQDGVGFGAQAVAVELEVLSADIYQTPVESYWIVGSVENQSAVPVQNVQLRLHIQNKQGDILTSLSAWMQPSVLLPNEQGTFAVQVAEFAEKPTDVTAEIESSSAVWQMAQRVRNYDVSIPTIANQDGKWTISAEGTAPLNTATENVIAYITLYNAKQSVVGFQQLAVADRLSAEETFPIETTILPLQSSITHAQILLYGTTATGE